MSVWQFFHGLPLKLWLGSFHSCKPRARPSCFRNQSLRWLNIFHEPPSRVRIPQFMGENHGTSPFLMGKSQFLMEKTWETIFFTRQAGRWETALALLAETEGADIVSTWMCGGGKWLYQLHQHLKMLYTLFDISKLSKYHFYQLYQNAITWYKKHWNAAIYIPSGFIKRGWKIWLHISHFWRFSSHIWLPEGTVVQ